ncbi:MAG TPA: pilin [Burkholderiales bacterium]|nr:pilin [Burkholderiales bacterium]
MEQNFFTPPSAELAEAPEAPLSLRSRLLRIGLVLLALGIAALIFLPSYADYTPRARVSEGILAASGLKQAITERLQSGTAPEKAGAGLTLPRQGVVKGGSVAENGSIYVVLEDPPAVITMRILSIDAATHEPKWECIGWPAKHMPASCRAPQ